MNFKEFENSARKIRKDLQMDSQVKFGLEEKIFEQIVPARNEEIKISLATRILDALTPKSLAVEHGLSFALILLLVVGSGFASLKASENTLPGSPFYPVKVASEKVDYLLSFTNEGRTRASMERALRRADEFNKIGSRISDQQDHAENAKKVSFEIQKELDNIEDKIKATDPASLVAVAREVDQNLKQVSAKVLAGDYNVEQASELRLEQTKIAKRVEEVDFLVLATMVDSNVDLVEVKDKILEKIDNVLADLGSIEPEQITDEVKEGVMNEMELAKTMLENEDPKGAIRKVSEARELLKNLTTQVDIIDVPMSTESESGITSDDVNIEVILKEEVLSDENDQGEIVPTTTLPVNEVKEGEFEINMFE